MSHRSKCYFILINFATDFFFKQGEPPSAFKDVSRKRLKSPASIIFFILVKVQTIEKKVENIQDLNLFSFSVCIVSIN